MKVYLAQYNLMEKSRYGGSEKREIVGVFSTKGKAVTALKAEMVRAIREGSFIAKRDDIKTTEFKSQGERCLELTFQHSTVDGFYCDCIGSIWAEELQ